MDMAPKKPNIAKAADQLVSLVQRHLSGLPQSEREKNIRALEKATDPRPRRTARKKTAE